MILQIKSFITLINVFFHLRKVFPLSVCVLCGCLLLRPTQWLNQYKVLFRQWETTRKCSIIKLNYRQALKETNKYFVTIKLHFFIAMMIENVYKACMVQWWQRKKAEKSVLGERQQTSAACWKTGWELKTRALLLVSREEWDTASPQSSPDKQPQRGAEEEAATQTQSKKCSSPLVWKCLAKLTDEKLNVGHQGEVHRSPGAPYRQISNFCFKYTIASSWFLYLFLKSSYLAIEY